MEHFVSRLETGIATACPNSQLGRRHKYSYMNVADTLSATVSATVSATEQHAGYQSFASVWLQLQINSYFLKLIERRRTELTYEQYMFIPDQK